MTAIIDRRLNGKNKSIVNAERFKKRYQAQAREAVKRTVASGNIKNIGKDGADVHIPKRNLEEPVFRHGTGGSREMVHPGNKEYIKGDTIEKPKGGGGKGSGSGKAGDSEGGEDDFTYHMNKEEFMQIFFDDLALPNMLRTVLADTPEFKTHRAGYRTDGTPSNLAVVRTMRQAWGRKLAFKGGIERKLAPMIEEFNELGLILPSLDGGEEYERAENRWAELFNDITAQKDRKIPYIDPVDIRYRGTVKTPVPMTKAVMFCLMDVSGSMDEQRKDMSKRFFILLYLFLTRHYEKIDLVFIRHHTTAEEVDEETFFNKRETGGTIVSSALTLADDIMHGRQKSINGQTYSPAEWNMYVAQASDGDNWGHDSAKCKEIIESKLLPSTRYFAYLQVAAQEQQLWDIYTMIANKNAGQFAMRKATSNSDIYPVFRELFKKKGVDMSALAAPSALAP